MRSCLLILALLMMIVGCKGAADSSSSSSGAVKGGCKASSDCQSGWRCLAKKCVDPRANARNTDPANAVTADKVRKELEQVNAEYEKKVDKALDM